VIARRDGFTVRALDVETWGDFAALAERYNGVWAGCWCMSFHLEDGSRGRAAARNRADKEQRVRDGRAHAALVYDGTEAVGWCQFGPVPELPRIRHMREYLAGVAGPASPGVPSLNGAPAPGALPDWRITCFFVDRRRRCEGIAVAALDGALAEIARLGGGVVESYPKDTAGRKVPGSFLYNGTVSMFEGAGFTRARRLGKHHWVVTREVSP
jgi:hypothetical protein